MALTVGFSKDCRFSTARLSYLPLEHRRIERPVWARSRHDPDVEAVIHDLKLPMAGLYSEPAIFFEEATGRLGRLTA